MLRISTYINVRTPIIFMIILSDFSELHLALTK